ncbi:MAG: glycosyltransferase family 39 protein, partial [Verrucomicrobia bacterium]|nr:glycosyltransferase family 39 protein [Verrucomicrobiota bacterium]
MDVDLIMAVDVIRATTLAPFSADLRRERTRAVAMACIVILAFAGWLGLEMPRGIVFGTDELLTAERTREMLLTDPWVVHYNFEYSFEKPPLQYWLTSLTLPRFQNRAVAVRIWPLFYGVLTAIALARLVRLILPDRPWLTPLSVAILISGPLFSVEAANGLLDIGLTFFTVLTIIFAEVARKKPAWWLGAAIGCWLGSLQKMPVPFLIWILILIVRLTNSDERTNLRKGIGWLSGSLIVAIALMSIWPLLQLLRYQMPVGNVFHQEVVVWLGPTGLGKRPYFEIPLRMGMIGGLCGLLSFLALFVVLFSRAWRSIRAVREIAIVSLLVIILAVLFNFRSVRYMLPIFPLLCFLLALVIARVWERGGRVRTGTIVALVVLFIAGITQSEITIALRHKNVADEKLIAEKLGALQRSGSETVLIKAGPSSDLLWDSFYLFHGNF